MPVCFKALLTAGVAVLFALNVAAPARAFTTLNASWVIQYSLDPNGTPGGSACVNFFGGTHSGNVVTGTWKSPTIAGWRGSWLVRGQHYQWYGSYADAQGNTFATYDVGDFINATSTAETSVATYQVTRSGSYPIATGTATMTQVASCKGQTGSAGPLLR